MWIVVGFPNATYIEFIDHKEIFGEWIQLLTWPPIISKTVTFSPFFMVFILTNANFVNVNEYIYITSTDKRYHCQFGYKTLFWSNNLFDI